MPWRRRKKREPEPKNEEEAEVADFGTPHRPEQAQESPEERHRRILGSPRTPFDVPGKTRTAWRAGSGGQLYPYPIVDAFLTCPGRDCTRLFTDNAGGRAALANHRKHDHEAR